MSKLKYDSLFDNKDLNDSAKKFLDVFLKEQPAYKVDAEPGWRMVVYVPIEGTKDIEVDIIPFNKWAVFTSLTFAPETKEEKISRYLLAKQQEQTMPVLPEEYSGPLAEYFDEIKASVQNWNHVPPPSLIMGCVSLSDNRTDEELIEKAKKDYSIWVKEVQSMEKAFEGIQSAIKKPKEVTSAESNLFGSVFGGGKNSKGWN